VNKEAAFRIETWHQKWQEDTTVRHSYDVDALEVLETQVREILTHLNPNPNWRRRESNSRNV